MIDEENPVKSVEADHVARVKEVLEKVRPYIQLHGGDVTLAKIEDGVVTLAISGACAHCSMADLTYNKLIGGLLMEEVPGIKNLILEMR